MYDCVEDRYGLWKEVARKGSGYGFSKYCRMLSILMVVQGSGIKSRVGKMMLWGMEYFDLLYEYLFFFLYFYIRTYIMSLQ